MPYLKIKTANNGDDDDWVIIDNLNLDELAINKATVTGEVTVSDFGNIKTTSTTLPKFINSEISTYVSSNTSPSFVFATNSDNSSTWTPSTGGLTASSGLFAIEERKDGYNLLWYSKKNTNGYSWARVHSIWG